MYPALMYLVTATYAILIMYYRRNHTLRILIIQVKRSPRLTRCHRRNHTLRILITPVKRPPRLRWIRRRFRRPVQARVLLSGQHHHQFHLCLGPHPLRPHRHRRLPQLLLHLLPLPRQVVSVLWTLMTLQWQGTFRCLK